MRIILSPAKKMRQDTDSIRWQELPVFLDKTQQILQTLKALSPEELQALWKCNDSIAQQNIQRLETMDLHSQLTPTVLAYEGIQYRYMAPAVFTEDQWAYVQEHLRILSGFYGILRPLDGICPYRLEMQAKLAMGESRDLYGFWQDSLACQLMSETNCIINLASKEYSRCISPFLPPETSFITCVFAQEKEGKILEKGTLCKMARGEMVRFLAENQVTDPEQMKQFCRLDFHFDASRSREDTYVFLQESQS